MERLKVIKRLVSFFSSSLAFTAVVFPHLEIFFLSSTSCRSITTRPSSSCPPTSKQWLRTPRRTRCESLSSSLFRFLKMSDLFPPLDFSWANAVLPGSCLLDGAQEPGHRVRSHSGAHHRGQHDPHGDTHAGPVQDCGDAHPECERRCFFRRVFKCHV